MLLFWFRVMVHACVYECGYDSAPPVPFMVFFLILVLDLLPTLDVAILLVGFFI